MKATPHPPRTEEERYDGNGKVVISYIQFLP